MNQARYTLASVFLIAIVAAVYFPVAGYPLVRYDDLAYVGENSFVLQGISWEGAKWAFTTNEQANWHPVTWLSHMLDCEVFGPDLPGRYHAVNVGLHIVNSLLTFFLLVRMTGTYWRPLLIGVIFAVHPLHVESVAWVSERKDVLSTFFWLACTFCYIVYVRRLNHESGRAAAAWYLAALFLLALGLMSKPMLVTVPCALLLLDYWPLSRVFRAHDLRAEDGDPPTDKNAATSRIRHKSLSSNRGKQKHRRRGKATPKNPDKRRSAEDEESRRTRPETTRMWVLGEKLPMLSLVLISSVVTYSVQSGGGAVGSVPLGHRVSTILMAYTQYLVKTVWPTNLAVLYPNHLHMWPAWQLLLAFILLGSVSAAVIAYRQHRYPTVGWLWYLGTLVPVVGFVQIGEHSMADRYMYVPMIGLLILLAWSLAGLQERWTQGRPIIIGTCIVYVVACGVLASIQVRKWQNTETLFRHAISATVRNHPMHKNLADELRRQGRADEAAKHYRHAIAIKPDFAEARTNWGAVLQDQGHPDKASEQYAAAIRIDPDLIEAYTNLGVVLDEQGKTDEAIAHFDQALEKDPAHAETLYNLAAVHFRLGKLHEAMNYYRQAIDAKPDYAEAYNNLGIILHEQKQFEKATHYLKEAIRLKKDYAEAYYNLGNVLVSAGRGEEAAEQYERSLQLNPADFRARFNLLRQLDRWDEALDVLQQAVRSRPGDSQLRNMLRIFKGEIRRKNAGG